MIQCHAHSSLFIHVFFIVAPLIVNQSDPTIIKVQQRRSDWTHLKSISLSIWISKAPSDLEIGKVSYHHKVIEPIDPNRERNNARLCDCFLVNNTFSWCLVIRITDTVLWFRVNCSYSSIVLTLVTTPLSNTFVNPVFVVGLKVTEIFICVCKWISWSSFFHSPNIQRGLWIERTGKWKDFNFDMTKQPLGLNLSC